MTMEDIASYKEMMMAHMNAEAVGGKHTKDYYEEDEEEEYWEEQSHNDQLHISNSRNE